MANNLSDVAENKLLDHITDVAAWTPTGPLKLALFTTAPNVETGAGGVEVTGGSYARQTITFDAASGGSASNQLVQFPVATANWGTVTASAVYDSNGTPVMIFSGPLNANKTIDSGDRIEFAAGQVTIALN